MPLFNVSIEAVETIFYEANCEVEAETAEEAEKIVKEDFYFDSSPYEVGSEGVTIQTTFCEEV